MKKHVISEDIRQLVENMVEDLRDLDDKTEINTNMLARAYGIDESSKEYDLFEIHYALLDAAQKNHIKLDLSEHDGKVEGLPYNFMYVVHNKKAQIKCPFCGSKDTARYFYGLPRMTEALQEEVDKGKVVLGGCCVFTTSVHGRDVDIMPKRRCNQCHKDFGKPPLLIDKKTNTGEDLRDLLSSVLFIIGGYSQGRKALMITKTEEGAMVHTATSPVRFDADSLMNYEISKKKWQKLVDTLYNELYVHEWKKRYVDDNSKDGTQWELEIMLGTNRRRHVYGNNQFPPYFKDLLKLFKKYMDL